MSQYLRARRCRASQVSDQRVSGGGSEAPFHQREQSSYWTSSRTVGGTWGCRLSQSAHRAQAWCQLEDSSCCTMEQRESRQKIEKGTH